MIAIPHVLTDSDVQLGLPNMALQYLGDATLWAEIVSLNNLIPPYLTTDPTQVYGPPIDTEALTQQVTAGDTSTPLVVTDQQLWAPGNLVVFAAASTTGQLLTEAQTVQSYDGATLAWLVGTQNTYPAGSQIRSYGPLPVGGYQVLLPGQTIYLPYTGASATGLPLSPTTAGVASFGTDAANPLVFANGDITLAIGPAVLAQRLSVRLGTVLGTLVWYPDFGTTLQEALGMPGVSAAWLAAIRQTILQENLVTDVGDITYQQTGNVLNLTATVYVSTQQEPITVTTQAFVPTFIS